MSKIKVCFSISTELKEKLLILAKEENRGIHPLCKKLVLQHLKKKGGK